MSTKRSWKDNLLSSSLPLEYEIASILVEEGFAVESDYMYSRTDSGVVKEFSVDIHATGYPPFNDPNTIWAEVHLLVECKHRSPDVGWLFLPEPNEPDLSPITLGYTLRSIDEFCVRKLRQEPATQFDAQRAFAFKGTEIRGNGKVYDQELVHGIEQLRYGLPRLLTDTTVFNMGSDPDEHHPFILCPILVTTAPLLLSAEDISITKVQESSRIEELASAVPYLVLHSDYGPDFERHCAGELEPLGNLGTYRVRNLDARLRQIGSSFEELPSQIGKALASGERYWLGKYFTQFIICSRDSFPDLIREIMQVGETSSRPD